MIIKAYKNRIYCDPIFEPIFINPKRILCIVPWDEHAIIYVTADLSFVTEKSFEELMKILKEIDCVLTNVYT